MRTLALSSLIVVVLSSSLHADDNAMEKRWTTDMIVVHHSESESGNSETFRRYHVNVNKWKDIGYHFVITNGRGGPDGEIQVGRGVELKGAHAGKATGRNSHSIGVCLVGTDIFTKAQKSVLVNLLVQLCDKYRIIPSDETIQSHHDKCPGEAFGMKEVINQVKHQVQSRTLQAKQ